MNFIRLVPERSLWPEMGEWVFEASKIFFLFCHLEPWHWYGRANSTLLIPSHDSYVWLQSLSMLSTAISTYRLNCHSVAPRRRDRNREAYYTILYLPVYFMLSETNLAKWEEEKKDRDNTNFNLQPLLYRMLDPSWPTQVTLNDGSANSYRTTESIKTQWHSTSWWFFWGSSKYIIHYEDEGLMAERQRLKIDES